VVLVILLIVSVALIAMLKGQTAEMTVLKAEVARLAKVDACSEPKAVAESGSSKYAWGADPDPEREPDGAGDDDDGTI
jgi:hypothetical protein